MPKKPVLAIEPQDFDGQVVAVIPGIEDYQTDEKGRCRRWTLPS